MVGCCFFCLFFFGWGLEKIGFYTLGLVLGPVLCFWGNRQVERTGIPDSFGG